MTPIRPAASPIETAEVPLVLPLGWDYDKVFGAPAKPHRKAMAMPQRTVAARAAPVSLDQAKRKATVDLPQTATAAELYLVAGMAAFGFGLALLGFARRRPA